MGEEREEIRKLLEGGADGAEQARQKQSEKERVTAKLKKMGACSAGFGWRKVPGGWVCAAGVCRMSDKELGEDV